MRSSRHRRRGYAMVMALLLLIIGAVLVAWLCSITRTGIAVARNDQSQARVMMATESGMQYALGKLWQVTTDELHPINETTDAATLYKVDLALVQAWQITGHSLVPPSDPANPIVGISGVPLVEGGSFDMDLRLSTRRPSGITLTVTGHSGSLSRTIGVELEFYRRTLRWMDYPIIARTSLSIAGNSNVFNWDPVTSTADTSDPGKAYPFSDRSGWALCFKDSPLPSAGIFPPKYPDASVYSKLNAMRSAGSLQQFIPTIDARGNPIPVSTLQNAYIPPNTTLVLDTNTTLSGIIYVGWPNTLNLGNNVTLRGMIIYEQPPAGYQPPALTKASPSCINAANAISVACDPAQGTTNVYNAFRSTCASDAEAQAYMDALWPWTIVAPDTDWNMAEGRTVSSFQFYGNIHIRSLIKAAGNGNASPSTYAFHGTIVCENLVDFRGDRTISIEPPATDGANDLRYPLGLRTTHGGYWEQ